MEILSIALASLSLLISGVTAWLTLLQKGTIKMTQPMLVAFAFENSAPKVFFRTLLYSTSRRGQRIESMYVKVRGPGTQHNFTTWGYTEDGSLELGSGLYVGHEGVSSYHHFLLPHDTTFEFLPGDYVLEMYASLVNKNRPIPLSKIELRLTNDQSQAIRGDRAVAVFYEWRPDSRSFSSRVDSRPRSLGMMHRQ